MKNIFFIILCAILAVNCTAFATGDLIYDYIIDDTHITVEFSSDSVLSAEKQQMIADNIIYGDDGVSTYAWCWLTGHDYVYENVVVIEHKVYVDTPRCIKKTYSVETCSKCDHFEETLIGESLLVCCPEE